MVATFVRKRCSLAPFSSPDTQFMQSSLPTIASCAHIVGSPSRTSACHSPYRVGRATPLVLGPGRLVSPGSAHLARVPCAPPPPALSSPRTCFAAEFPRLLVPHPTRKTRARRRTLRAGLQGRHESDTPRRAPCHARELWWYGLLALRVSTATARIVSGRASERRVPTTCVEAALCRLLCWGAHHQFPASPTHRKPPPTLFHGRGSDSAAHHHRRLSLLAH